MIEASGVAYAVAENGPWRNVVSIARTLKAYVTPLTVAGSVQPSVAGPVPIQDCAAHSAQVARQTSYCWRGFDPAAAGPHDKATWLFCPSAVIVAGAPGGVGGPYSRSQARLPATSASSRPPTQTSSLGATAMAYAS